MTLIANVSLNDTFDIWRIKTNQIINKTNQLDTTDIITLVSNTSTINISGDFFLGNTIYLDSNAFPITGGTITGNTIFASNVTINANSTFNNTSTFNANVTFNSVVTIANGVLDLL